MKLHNLTKTRGGGHYSKIAAALVTAVCALAAQADTLTWKGGSSGKFSEASNWTSAATGGEAAPQSGDTVVFPSSSVELTAETFNLGSAGLTIENPAALTSHVTFTGSGGIVKRGVGHFIQMGDAGGTFTGGARFENGRLVLKNRYLTGSTGTGKKYFGSGEVELVNSGSVHPIIDYDEWTSGLTNAVRVTGSNTATTDGASTTFYGHNPITQLAGPIVATGNFTIYQAYGTTTHPASISAPGHTVVVNSRYVINNKQAVKITLNGPIDASVRKINPGPLTLGGVSPGLGNSLMLEGGTNEITSAGYWGGTNIVVKGATSVPSVLLLQGVQNLNPMATVSISSGGSLSLAAQCRVIVCKLVVDGVEQPGGVYTASSLPGTISGSGQIRVIGSDMRLWTGGASGYWSEPSNWLDGVVPKSGDACFFQNGTSLLNEEVDLGEAGFTIFNTASISNHVTFTGSGRIVKMGFGQFFQMGDAGGTFTGGVRFEDGQLVLNNRYLTGTSGSAGKKYFGSGEVELVNGSAHPKIDYAEWTSGLTNAVRVTGANTKTDTNSTFYAHNAVSTSLGPIVATGDFTIYQSFGTFTHSAPISAPGHTVVVNCTRVNSNSTAVKITLNGPIDASVRKINPGPLTLGGVSPGLDNSLSFEGGTNTINVAAQWGGTNVVVSGASTLLKLTAAGNLSADATVSVTGNAKIEIASGVRVSVGGFSIGGVQQPRGIYTAENCPGTITGAGRLRVGLPGLSIVIR